MAKNSYGNYFKWADEQRNPPQKPVRVKREKKKSDRSFTMPKLPKFDLKRPNINFAFPKMGQMSVSDKTAMRWAIAALGATVLGIGYLTFSGPSVKKETKKPSVTLSYTQRKALAEKEDKRITDSLFATVANDVTQLKQQMDTVYTSRLAYYGKDVSVETGASLACDDTKVAFAKQLGDFSAKHTGMKLTVSDCVLGVEGQVNGKPKSLYSSALTKLTLFK